MMPYNRIKNVLSVLLNKTFPSLFCVYCSVIGLNLAKEFFFLSLHVLLTMMVIMPVL